MAAPFDFATHMSTFLNRMEQMIHEFKQTLPSLQERSRSVNTETELKSRSKSRRHAQQASNPVEEEIPKPQSASGECVRSHSSPTKKSELLNPRGSNKALLTEMCDDILTLINLEEKPDPPPKKPIRYVIDTMEDTAGPSHRKDAVRGSSSVPRPPPAFRNRVYDYIPVRSGSSSAGAKLIKYKSKAEPQNDDKSKLNDLFTPEFEELFGKYASKKTYLTVDQTPLIMKHRSTEWLENAGLIDLVFNANKASSYFADVAGTNIMMTIEQYVNFLAFVARKKNKRVSELLDIMGRSPGPRKKPASAGRQYYRRQRNN